VVPLVHEARDWQHGTFLGSIISSEKTAAAAGKVGELRRDPMAMLPFCGYNMGDYWAHWLNIGRRAGAVLPKVYYVNCGENGRVLKWVFERCLGTAKATETPIGNVPAEGALDLTGLDEVSRDDLAELLRVDVDGWLAELPLISEYYDQFGSHLPGELRDELQGMKERLEAAKS